MIVPFTNAPMKKFDKKFFAAVLAAAALFMYGAVMVRISIPTAPSTAPSGGDARPR